MTAIVVGGNLLTVTFSGVWTFMNLMVRRGKERMTVLLNGRMDEDGARLVRDKLMAEDARPFREVELDISSVTFIGSAGISKLLLLRTHFASQKSVLRLINPPGHIFELFQSMRLDKLFGMQRA